MKKILVFCLGFFALTAAGTASASDIAKWVIGGAIVGKAIGHDRNAAITGAAIGALAGVEAERNARYRYSARARYYAPGYSVRYHYTSPPRYYYRQHSRPRINIQIHIR